jgi:hypothetical protein
MSLDHVRSSLRSGTTIVALLTALLCAAAAWTIDAGSALAPEPADLSDPLSGGAGTTAAAVTVTQQTSTVLLWPGTYTSGGGPAVFAGAPCSTSGLALGLRTTKRIQANASGTQHRCVKYDPLQPPPANFVRPLPPMPNAAGTGTKDASDAITTTVTNIVTVVMWPADWMFSGDEGLGPRPEPGQPCSDFALLAGERTYKHIQRKGTENVDGPFRCVRLQDPIVYPEP